MSPLSPSSSSPSLSGHPLEPAESPLSNSFGDLLNHLTSLGIKQPDVESLDHLYGEVSELEMTARMLSSLLTSKKIEAQAHNIFTDTLASTCATLTLPNYRAEDIDNPATFFLTLIKSQLCYLSSLSTENSEPSYLFLRHGEMVVPLHKSAVSQDFFTLIALQKTIDLNLHMFFEECSESTESPVGRSGNIIEELSKTLLYYYALGDQRVHTKISNLNTLMVFLRWAHYCKDDTLTDLCQNSLCTMLADVKDVETLLSIKNLSEEFSLSFSDEAVDEKIIQKWILEDLPKSAIWTETLGRVCLLSLDHTTLTHFIPHISITDQLLVAISQTCPNLKRIHIDCDDFLSYQAITDFFHSYCNKLNELVFTAFTNSSRFGQIHGSLSFNNVLFSREYDQDPWKARIRVVATKNTERRDALDQEIQRTINLRILQRAITESPSETESFCSSGFEADDERLDEAN